MRWLAFLAAFMPGAALAGADAADGHDDEAGPNAEEGPAYFGFVKDSGGVPVRDAKVSASYRNKLTLVTRTNATGAYKLPGFKKDISPDEVTISCAKEGYRQVRVFRHPAPRGRPVKAVETECRLQREKS
ncbi:MAG: hypothetical protein QOD26_1507 [Betaproteobacteria bacterium]|jgi:hypothetical protein|nr:hypothetical protein [Betaproteobacteria bacterium]